MPRHSPSTTTSRPKTFLLATAAAPAAASAASADDGNRLVPRAHRACARALLERDGRRGAPAVLTRSPGLAYGEATIAGIGARVRAR